MTKSAEDEKNVATNRQARHDYFIIESWEAGMALTGTEVKSLREGRANLKESYADIIRGEAFLLNAHISPYSCGNRANHDPLRKRKLLLHKKELRKLIGRVEQQGLTLIPLRLYFKRGRAKVELALAKGKKLYDKRDDLKRRASERDMERALRPKL